MSYLDDEIARLEYALCKQIRTVDGLQTNYGVLELDYEMQEAVRKVLEPKLRKKIKQLEREIKAAN